MKYRCQVIFTTRNRHAEETELEVTEIRDESTLIHLFRTFCEDADEKTVLAIIHAVHAHTFLVELAARLLHQGMMSPDELLAHLYEEGAGLTAEEYIIATKDKQRRKRTYREHIRRLFQLYALFAPEQEFLRCLSLAPSTGVNAQIFSRMMGRRNLNSANTLGDMGLLQRQECHRILLHPLIFEVVLADLKPSVQNCSALLEQIHFLMLHHGGDLEHISLICAIVERSIALTHKDDAEFYLRFLEDCFTGLTDYPCRGTPILIQNTLHQLLEDTPLSSSRDHALLLENEAFLSKTKKHSLTLHKEALEVLEIEDKASAQLASNIYSNLSLEYQRQEKMSDALQEAEAGIEILRRYDLIGGHDSMVQLWNYALLCLNCGKISKGMTILEQLCALYEQKGLQMCSDYAAIQQYMAMAYSQMGNTEKTMECCRRAWVVFQQVWGGEPELLRKKQWELTNLLSGKVDHGSRSF